MSDDPIDWAARFLAAAEVAEAHGHDHLAHTLRLARHELEPEAYAAVVAAIGRALLGEEDQQR